MKKYSFGSGAKLEKIPDEEHLRKLAELKTYLENKTKDIERELNTTLYILEIVDEELARKSFKRLELPKVIPPIKVSEPKNIISLKTSLGLHLADMIIEKNSILVKPVAEMIFNVNTPPFQAFLIKKVLDNMQLLDTEASKSGELDSSKIFSYDLILKDDVLKEIVIKNYGNDRRLKELQTSIRWTFEKMYEKTRIS